VAVKLSQLPAARYLYVANGGEILMRSVRTPEDARMELGATDRRCDSVD
jgi:hypothetical protein